jgi:hypothetical protein
MLRRRWGTPDEILSEWIVAPPLLYLNINFDILHLTHILLLVLFGAVLLGHSG